MRRFVAVDLETTGVDYTQDYIIEVGLAGEDVNGKYFEQEFSLPFPEDAMTKGAAAVNGWGKRKFPPPIGFTNAIVTLEALLEDVHIVGKNPSFDEAFLRNLLRLSGRYGYNQPFPWHYRMVDVGNLAWGAHSSANAFLEDEVIPVPPNVEQVETVVGIHRDTVDGFHTAMCDAKWAYKVFRNIVPRKAK